MLLEVYDKYTRLRIDVIRKFTFAQYEEKFCDVGSFTIKIPYNESSIPNLKRDNYILLDKDVVGIIKYKHKISDEQNSSLEIRGYLLNHLLSYRSFLKTTKYSGNIVTIVREMVNDLCISNNDARRNFGFIKLSNEQKYIPIVNVNINYQNTGDKLSDVLNDVLEGESLGYKLVPELVNYDEKSGIDTNMKSFEFRLYKSENRTVSNGVNVPVVFSIDLNNLSVIDYTEDNTEYKSVGIVAGEGEGSNRKIVETGSIDLTGLDRIEYYIDARDLQSEIDGEKIPEKQYEEMLIQRGKEKLQSSHTVVTVDGTTVQNDKTYKYGIDYNLGDFVTLRDNDLCIDFDLQITSVTKSISETGEITDIKFGREKLSLNKIVKRGK